MVDDLLAACAALEGEGLTTAFGHLSARDGDDVIVTSNEGPGLVRDASQLLRVSHDGDVLEGDPARRAGELPIHLGIYAARPDVMSVCRFHGPSCMAWSTLGRPLPATTGIGMFLGADVPVYDTARTVTTPEQGAELAAVLAGGNAVLLRGFGAATVGRTIPEAVVRAWLLERSATFVLTAAAVGEPRAYSSEAAAPFAAGDGPAAAQIARAWQWLTTRNPRPETMT